MVKDYRLETVVLVCGAVTMVLEMTGSRILGPYVGTSTYTWTSLIGVILGAMSLGYWLGGRWADSNANKLGLSKIILAAGGAIGIIFFVKDLVLQVLTQTGIDTTLAAIGAAIGLFFGPSLLLGMVSPIAAKIRLNSVENSGQTVGNLYALSTLGSILGTFLAGYFLIPSYGSGMVLIILTVTLTLLSLLLSGFDKWKGRTGLIVLVTVLATLWPGSRLTKKLLADVDTEYSRVWIFDTIINNRSTRCLTTDPTGIQSAKYLDSDELVFDYTKYYRLGDVFNQNINEALMIGGAGYSYPRDFLARHLKATMTVVEIDPGMTRLAKEYFGLKENPRLRITHEDGRVFLNRNKNKYDVIYIDAFNSTTVPFQLTTVEAIRKMWEALEADGVVLTNLISAREGEKAEFLRAEYKTYKEVFPSVWLFRVKDEVATKKQNIMLVAFKETRTEVNRGVDGELASYLETKMEIKGDMEGQRILSDDWAPVEKMVEKG
ncbi:MAG: fused MFS/spermidine synthase [Candidatus Shapirobacteria bacterium]